jgi:hypothetical protein
MKKSSLKVVLGMSKLSIAAKINRARVICDAILSNPAIFATPNPPITSVQTAIDDLEAAAQDAADGGKTKTAIMHDKEDALMKLMFDLAHYVESVANGDSEVVHLASMHEKQKPVFHAPEFQVENGADRGDVWCRVKPKTKTVYKWQYCKDPMGTNAWTDFSITDVASVHIGPLVTGATYWIRVIFIGRSGETMPYQPQSIVIV